MNICANRYRRVPNPIIRLSVIVSALIEPGEEINVEVKKKRRSCWWQIMNGMVKGGVVGSWIRGRG